MLRSLLTSKKSTGRRTVFAETALWSLFPILTASTLAHVPPFTALTISTAVVCLILLATILATKHFSELRNAFAWKHAGLAAYCIDVVYYSFIFVGLTMTSPGNAAIIGLCEVFSSYILFNVLRGERIPTLHRIGGVLVVSGALIILCNGYTGFNYGDILIFLSICIAPLGNLFQKKAAAVVHHSTVILMRALIALPILIGLTFIFESSEPLLLTSGVIWALAINGLLIATTRLLWLVSITDLPPAEACALSSTGPLLTIIVMWILFNIAPSPVQLISVPFIIVGVFLLSRDTHRRHHR